MLEYRIKQLEELEYVKKRLDSKKCMPKVVQGFSK